MDIERESSWLGNHILFTSSRYLNDSYPIQNKALQHTQVSSESTEKEKVSQGDFKLHLWSLKKFTGEENLHATS